jgi:hypothetical protein
MTLQTMTVSKLKCLRREVEAAISAKVTERRREIETELTKLSQFEAGKPAKIVGTRARVVVAVKGGKKLDESSGADGAPKQPKQLKRTRKASKPGQAAKSADKGLSFPATANNIEALPVKPPSVASIDAPVDISAAA